MKKYIHTKEGHEKRLFVRVRGEKKQREKSPNVCRGWAEAVPGAARRDLHCRGVPSMTLDTKLTMALAGCSGSSSANR